MQTLKFVSQEILYRHRGLEERLPEAEVQRDNEQVSKITPLTEIEQILSVKSIQFSLPFCASQILNVWEFCGIQ